MKKRKINQEVKKRKINQEMKEKQSIKKLEEVKEKQSINQEVKEKQLIKKLEEEKEKQKQLMEIKKSFNEIIVLKNKIEKIFKEIKTEKQFYPLNKYYYKNDNHSFQDYSSQFDREYNKRKDGINNIPCFRIFLNGTSNFQEAEEAEEKKKNHSFQYIEMTKNFGKFIEIPIRNSIRNCGIHLQECNRVFSESCSSTPDGIINQPFCWCSSLFSFCQIPLEIKTTISKVKTETVDSVLSYRNFLQMISHIYHYRAHFCLYFHYFKHSGNHFLCLIEDSNGRIWNMIEQNKITENWFKENYHTFVIPIYHYCTFSSTITFSNSADDDDDEKNTTKNNWAQKLCFPFSTIDFWKNYFTTWF